MRCLLLNSGGYQSLNDVDYPVEVECHEIVFNGAAVMISGHELIGIGGDKNLLDDHITRAFIVGDEVEILEEIK